MLFYQIYNLLLLFSGSVSIATPALSSFGRAQISCMSCFIHISHNWCEMLALAEFIWFSCFLLLLLFYCSLLAASGCVCCICDNIQILLSLESFATLFHVHVRMCVRVHVLPLAESTMHSIFMFDFVSQINSVRHFKRIQIIPFSR